MKKLFLALTILALFQLTVNNTATAQINQALAFKGTTQYSSMPAGRMNGVSVFTVEFWINTTETGSSGTYWQRPTMFGNENTGAPAGDFAITTNSGFLGMWSGLYTEGHQSFISAAFISDNSWHQVAARSDGSTIRFLTMER